MKKIKFKLDSNQSTLTISPFENSFTMFSAISGFMSSLLELEQEMSINANKNSSFFIFLS